MTAVLLVAGATGLAHVGSAAGGPDGVPATCRRAARRALEPAAAA
jgi:hypothetical protein